MHARFYNNKKQGINSNSRKYLIFTSRADCVQQFCLFNPLCVWTVVIPARVRAREYLVFLQSRTLEVGQHFQVLTSTESDDKTGGDSGEKLQPFEDEWLDFSQE